MYRWVFEKYDGVRGFWNPATKTFYSRSGHPLRLPQEVTDAMPNDIFLDGEIWYIYLIRPQRLTKLTNFYKRFGRDSFQETVKMSRSIDQSSLPWDRFRYMVYDIPVHKGRYEERYAALCKYSLKDKHFSNRC